MRILVTNDDGIAAPGLVALVDAIDRWCARGEPGARELVVVAPETNHSGSGASVGEVYRRTSVAYRRHRYAGHEGVDAFALDASPALCVLIGVLGGIGARPDVVVAGINAGVNVGRSVLHSGTVGAILAGSQLGLSGLAVSIQWTEGAPYDVAADVAVEVLDQLVKAPPRTLLNLNVPALARGELRGVRRGRISTAGIVKSAGRDDGVVDLGEAGEIALRLGSAVPSLGDVSDEEPEDDGALVAAGFASLTPLRSVHEDTDTGADDTVRAALDAVSQHLHA
ncbi:MAG TPA: 5'/3'-nucleotidase SurE [Acidimicrobiales bacterium]|nr:5'/3'-nucleotidase SurE [Acidimicrobiales bacterium]